MARRCQGFRSVATPGIFFARTSADVERAAADIFSRSIREYSAGEHVPRAIINERRPIVSHEASANSAMITAGDRGAFRLRMSWRWGRRSKTQFQQMRRAALGWHFTWPRSANP